MIKKKLQYRIYASNVGLNTLWNFTTIIKEFLKDKYKMYNKY